MPFWTREPTLLERTTERAIRELENHLIGSDDYVRTLDSVIKLHKMKEEEQRTSSVSKDTLVIVGANLLGIIMILRYERLDVITSKAMNLVLKPK